MDYLEYFAEKDDNMYVTRSIIFLLNKIFTQCSHR